MESDNTTKKINIKINILEVVLLAILLFTLFVSGIFTKEIFTIILMTYAIITYLVIRKKDKVISYKKQIIFQMIMLSLIYISLYYLFGIYFGFYKNSTNFSVNTIRNYIIPYLIIIIASEIIRYEFLCTQTKMSKILTFTSMVLIDVSIYSNIYDIAELNGFLALMGLVTFSSISCNLLYNYMTPKFGFKPIIVYRLITTLYMYFMPILPDVYTFLRATVRIIYPYIIYLILEYMYSKNKNVQEVEKINNAKNIIRTIAVVVIAILITMLVSCEFYVGIICIASGSMEDTINVGDVAVYVQYTNQKIEKGDIILFNKNHVTTIHRVIKIVTYNNETRYWTKGDKNEVVDDGYITNEDIIGIYKFRIQYIGYPTLWLREMFS